VRMYLSCAGWNDYLHHGTLLMCYQLVIFLDMCLVLLVYEPAVFPTMLVPDTTGEKLRSWYAWSCKG
jgi:hypothetical protein